MHEVLSEMSTDVLSVAKYIQVEIYSVASFKNLVIKETTLSMHF